MARRVIVLPDDSARPILAAIEGASRTLRVKMFVFSDPGLVNDGRRELAIEVRDHHVVERLRQVVHHDWERSHPLDLSDEGLLADLEDRTKGGAEMLGLE